MASGASIKVLIWRLLEGHRLKLAGSGVVVEARNAGGFGNMVIISHSEQSQNEVRTSAVLRLMFWWATLYSKVIELAE